MQLTPDQQQHVLGIVSENPWGDTAGSLALIDEALAIAMLATRDEFIYWEQRADANGFVDEFSINDVSALSPEWRHALVARLLRSIAMAYGVGTDLGRDEIGQVDLDWGARLLHSAISSRQPPGPNKPRRTPLRPQTSGAGKATGKRSAVTKTASAQSRIYVTASLHRNTKRSQPPTRSRPQTSLPRGCNRGKSQKSSQVMSVELV